MAEHEIVDRYSGLARAARAGEAIADCGREDFDQGCFGAHGYNEVSSLPIGAVRTSLGCGNPVAVADLCPGETVLDLGSGGGIDVLLSAKQVGPEGKVYGLDASDDMLDLARSHAEQAGAANVEFLRGSTENIPLPDRSIDVLLSNCVVNLSSDKPKVAAEIVRVLKPGGRIGISDVIAEDGTTQAQRTTTEQRVGCLAGALTTSEYHNILTGAGLRDVSITATFDHGDGVHSAIIRAAKPE